MDIKSFLENWLEVSNSYNIQKYLAFYHTNAILDDPSVGKKFIGHKGIQEYYTSYFIGYKTQTKLEKLEIMQNTAYVEVEFTGEFPGGKIQGSFDFTFNNEKIIMLKADLI